MSAQLTLLVAAAMAGLLVAGVRKARRMQEWQPFALNAVILGLFALFLHFLVGFPEPANETTGKGSPSDDLALVIVMAVCMLLGMLAQSLYYHFSLPKKVRVHKKFDWGTFFAPVCAAPIVFIPLMVALQNANIDLHQMTIPRMMILFVAFQNGFFWKEHFDRKRKDAKEER
jgi:hypothetical protein